METDDVDTGSLNSIANEIVQAGTIACALLLVLGIALGGFEEQLAAMMGQPYPTLGPGTRGRGVTLVLFLALAASATVIAAAVSEKIGSGGNLGTGMAELAKMAVDALIVLGALLLALGFAVSGVSAQVGSLLGLPGVQAKMLARLFGLVAAFLATVLAIPVANTVIDTLLKGQGQ